MKKKAPKPEKGLRPEYRREDLGKGVRGKYYEAYNEGTSFEVTAPDRRENGALVKRRKDLD